MAKKAIYIFLILILSLAVIFSLAASKPISHIKSKGRSISLNASTTTTFGIGMFNGQVNKYTGALLASGFNQLRIDIPDYQDARWVELSKTAVKEAIAKGAKVIWGVSSNSRNNSAYTITADNWPQFRQAILSAAQWAQDNGVYEFQLGNEENFHNDDTTMSDAQLRAEMRSLATEVQAIFTNGNISYTFGDTWAENAAWISEGKGDLDIIASNIYKGGSEDSYDHAYQTRIKDMVDAFGDDFYLTEFGPSYTSLVHYSSDEAEQAAALNEMIEYINSIGVERALFFDLEDDVFGLIREDGTYRMIWDVLTY